MGCIISVSKEMKFQSTLNPGQYRLIKYGEFRKSFLLAFEENQPKTIYVYATKETHHLKLITVEDEYILLFSHHFGYVLIDTLRSHAAILSSNLDLHHVTNFFCCTPTIDYSDHKPLKDLFQRRDLYQMSAFGLR